MRKSLILTLLALLSLTASAQQIRIPGTKAELQLPEGEWRYYQTEKLDKNTSSHLYYYAQEIVKEEDGDTVVPWVRVVVRKNFSGSPLDYVAERWAEQPYQLLDELTTGLPTSDAVSYRAAYTSPRDHGDYLFRLLYFKERNNVIELRAETSTATYERMAPIFESIISSLTISK